MKEIKLFGITIKDYTLKESLNMSRSFLHEEGVHTVSYLSRDNLMSVLEYPMQKSWIQDLDLVLFTEPIDMSADNNIFHAAHDGKYYDYLETFLKNMVAAKESIYLIADNSENLTAFKHRLLDMNHKLNIIGEKVYLNEELEKSFNEINCLSPSVVLSCLPWNVQGTLMIDAKRMLNTHVWIGFLPEFIGQEGSKLKELYEDLLGRLKFFFMLKKYNKK